MIAMMEETGNYKRLAGLYATLVGPRYEVPNSIVVPHMLRLVASRQLGGGKVGTSISRLGVSLHLYSRCGYLLIWSFSLLR